MCLGVGFLVRSFVCLFLFLNSGLDRWLVGFVFYCVRVLVCSCVRVLGCPCVRLLVSQILRVCVGCKCGWLIVCLFVCLL